MPSLLPIVNKARKPKFELHLTIYDLNNVPLVSGTSHVKWHLPHSMHGEHRGRTNKCPIDSTNHRVSYNDSRVIPLRITIDKNNNLTECPVEFEVVQEFPMATGGNEKITLGIVKLNLSEYVEESENFPRRSTTSRLGTSLEFAREKILGPALQGPRKVNSAGSQNGAGGPISSTNTGVPEHTVEENVVEEGIVRRYLMQDSKINSTLKIGILMLQIDGERNFVAPPLKTAPMFGGIAGIMAGESGEPVDDSATKLGAAPNATSANKTRDASELQDMYRRSLAASWACQSGDLPADECIEDIFAGGDGWKDSESTRKKKHHNRGRHAHFRGDREDPSTSSGSASGSEEAGGGTLRPSDVRKMRQNLHRRNHSASSEKSLQTVTGRRGSSDHLNQLGGASHLVRHGHRNHRQNDRRDESVSSLAGFESTGGMRSRRESLASLAPTLGSLTDRDRGAGREELGRPREVDESEARDDLVSWALPGTVY